MRMRGLAFVALVGVLTGPAAGVPALARGHHPHHFAAHHPALRNLVVVHAKVAPADEYFGRMKMSILGVQNTLKDLSAKLAFAPDSGADVLHSAYYVEDAIHDWEHKYPQDSWLPKSVFNLSQLYSSIKSDEGQRRAAATLHWLIARYPHTAFAATARNQVSAQIVK